MKQGKEFVWTEELVKECIDFINSCSPNWEHIATVEQYKFFKEIGIKKPLFKTEKMGEFTVQYLTQDPLTNSIPAGAGTANDVLNTGDGKGRGKEWGTAFERLAYWGTHSGWGYYDKGNEPTIKLSHFEHMIDQIQKETQPTANDVLNPVKPIEINDATRKFIKEFEEKVDEAKEYMRNALGIFKDKMGNDVPDMRYSEFDKKVIKKYSDQIQPLNTEREWEIVALVDGDGRISRSSGMINFFMSQSDRGKITIHSVKRLRDNEVFSVGEVVDHKVTDQVWGPIKKFDIIGKDMMVYGDGFQILLQSCKKRSQPTPSQPQNNAPCRVKITQCSFEQGWYKDLIGEEFDVDLASPPRDYVLWEDYTNPNKTIAWRHIACKDCIRISRPQNNKEEVSDLIHFSGSKTGKWYRFHKSGFDLIPHEKFHAIKMAIEQVLNDEVHISEEEFNAARRIKKGLYPTIVPMDYEYPNYQDYLNRKNQKQ